MKIAVVGGNSHSARAFVHFVRHRRPEVELLSFVRSEGPAIPQVRVARVANYDDITEDQLVGCDAAINFVGTATARDPEILHAVNVGVARQLALAARSAGVRQFVHLSSLSIHGPVPEIVEGSRLSPASAYGVSKAGAEYALQEISSPEFAVTMLRIPTIYGRGRPSKIESLARLLDRVPAFPMPAVSPRRSVISDENLARVMMHLLDEEAAGAVYAADPQPFTIDMLVQILRGTRIVRLPDVAFAPLRLLLPGVERSLFGSLEIDDALLVKSKCYPLISTAESLSRALGRGK